MRWSRVATQWYADLTDLVLPAECAGCRVGRTPLRQGVCAACAREVESLAPRPVRPTPAPEGLPPCHALGPYAGPLRELLLAYKERGRYGLARPLGALLAEVVASAVGTPQPLLLVPVPDTAAAARARYGDHLRRLAVHASARLVRAGWPTVVAHPVRAASRTDSTALDSVGRARAAAATFRLRSGWSAGGPGAAREAGGRVVILLDDIVTTGATLAAVAGLLAGAGFPVRAAAVLAATQRRVAPDPRGR